MTDLEDRLVAALDARADAVTPDAAAQARLRAAIRRRRRRLLATATGVVALTAAASVAAVATVRSPAQRAAVRPAATSSTPTPSATPPPPDYGAPERPVGPVSAGTDGVAALAGAGPVLLDVTSGTARTVPGSGAAHRTAVGLSYDGRYVVSTDDTSLAVTDRAGAVLLRLDAATAPVAWAPTRDDLAVVEAGALAVYRVGTTVQRIADVALDPGPGGLDGVAWSSDGRRLAASGGHELVVVDASGHRTGGTTFRPDTYPQPATWSGDGSRLVVLLRTDSGSIDADGVDVVDLDATGRRIGSLPAALPEPRWWHPLDGDAVLGTVGDDREVSSGKTVVRCDLATARCTTLAGDGRTSAFGAVPTAGGVAYLAVDNSASGDDGLYPQAYHLVLAGPDGSGAHVAPGAPVTVAQVLAGADGRTLLLVGAAATGPPGVYRYDGGSATRLTDVSTDDQIGYYGDCKAIVDWRQPAAGAGS